MHQKDKSQLLRGMLVSIAHLSMLGIVLAHGPESVFIHEYGGTDKVMWRTMLHYSPCLELTLTSLDNASWLLEENETLVVGKMAIS